MSRRRNRSESYLVIVRATECVLVHDSLDGTLQRKAASWGDTSLAGALNELLEGLEVLPRNICFALSSELCLSCRFVLDSRAGRTTPEALRYATEEHLPVSAEDFAAVFHSRGSDVLCVVAERDLIAELAAATTGTTRVMPLSLLIAQSAVHDASSPHPVTVTFSDRNRREVIEWDSGPLNWRSDVTCGGLEARLTDVELFNGTDPRPLKFDEPNDTDSPDLTGLESFAFNAARSLSSARLNALDLLRDSFLGRTGVSKSNSAIQRCCQLLVFVSVIAVALLLRRQNALTTELAQVDDVQARVFHEIMPSVAPQGINRKLESELKLRTDILEQKAEWLAQREPSDELFARILTSCIQLKRTALNSIEVRNGIGTLEVEAQDARIANIVAQELAKVGLTSEPVSTTPINGLHVARLTVVAEETP